MCQLKPTKNIIQRLISLLIWISTLQYTIDLNSSSSRERNDFVQVLLWLVTLYIYFILGGASCKTILDVNPVPSLSNSVLW